MNNFGENIWDVSSWTSDINWKDWYLHHFFDNLTFLECIEQIIDLSETYFQSVYDNYNGAQEEDEEGLIGGGSYEFPYLDILVLLTEEYLYGHYFHSVTPLQEIQLLEILCRYFQENKLDPIRYFVFDCLFGLPKENLELQKGLMDFKLNVMCKLTSMAIGTQCSNVLNCVAVWFHTYGSRYGYASKVAHAIINDYCFICPNAMGSIKDLINISPVFANQFVRSVAKYYKDTDKDGEQSIPPPQLTKIIAKWIIDEPKFCLIKIPDVFLSLPSIHKFTINLTEAQHFNSCPLFSLIDCCLIEPLIRDKNLNIESDDSKMLGKISIETSNSLNKLSSETSNSLDKLSSENATVNSEVVYSMLHYSLINFLSSQKKVEALKEVDNDSDEEEGELLEENDGVELLSNTDVMYLIRRLQKYLIKFQEVGESIRGESIDRLIQLLQVAKSVGCLSLVSKQLVNLLLDLPKTRLLKQVIDTLS